MYFLFSDFSRKNGNRHPQISHTLPAGSICFCLWYESIAVVLCWSGIWKVLFFTWWSTKPAGGGEIRKTRQGGEAKTILHALHFFYIHTNYCIFHIWYSLFCKDFRLENLYYFWRLYIFYADWGMMLILNLYFHLHRLWGMVFVEFPGLANKNLIRLALIESSECKFWQLITRILSWNWTWPYFFLLCSRGYCS